ncbi:MAG: hypothetical protein AB8G11_21525 [Saprospiraceae bacterium]
MKIVRLPFGSKTYSFLHSLFHIIGTIAFISIIVTLLHGTWSEFFICLIIYLPVGIYDWLFLTDKILFLPKHKIEIQFITKIDKYGFTIYCYGDNIETRYEWQFIEYCKLNDANNLIIKPIKKQENIIKIDSERDFELLSCIPKSKLLDNQIPDFIHQVCSNVTNCKVCGTIAVWSNKCLSCASDVYNAETHDEFENEIDHLKEEQLELFSADDKVEKVDFFNEEETFFERDKNWKPLVTEAEVIAYSKEWNWD